MKKPVKMDNMVGSVIEKKANKHYGFEHDHMYTIEHQEQKMT